MGSAFVLKFMTAIKPNQNSANDFIRDVFIMVKDCVAPAIHFSWDDYRK